MRTRLALWITPVWFCHVVIWEKQKKGQNLHLSFPFLSSSGIQGFEEEKLASFLSIPLLFWAGKVLEAGALLPCIVVLPCFGGRCVVSLALPWHPKAVDGSHVDLLSTPPCLRSYPNRSTTDLYVCMYIYIHTHTQRERERERERDMLSCFFSCPVSLSRCTYSTTGNTIGPAAACPDVRPENHLSHPLEPLVLQPLRLLCFARHLLCSALLPLVHVRKDQWRARSGEGSDLVRRVRNDDELYGLN